MPAVILEDEVSQGWQSMDPLCGQGNGTSSIKPYHWSVSSESNLKGTPPVALVRDCNPFVLTYLLNPSDGSCAFPLGRLLPPGSGAQVR